MLEVSHNSMSTARGCWMKYYWHYIYGITPKRKSLALTLGSAIHEAFESYYNGSTDCTVINHIKNRFDECENDPERDEEHRIAMHTALGMWGFYPWKDTREFKEYEVEKEFRITLGKLRGVRFRGRVDGLVKKDGVWWVREVKTTGLTPRQFTGRCATSAQATGYVYAMQKLGYNVAGVMFDMIKKPLLRRRVNESADDFGLRIMTDYKEDSLRPEGERKAYKRHFEYRSPEQLSQWVEDSTRQVRDIRQKIRKKDWWHDRDSCWVYNRLCSYDVVCGMRVPDELTVKMYFETKH